MAEINVSEGGSLRTRKCTLLFINDLEKEMNSEKTKFAGDTKSFRIIKSKVDHELLHNELAALSNWMTKW